MHAVAQRTLAELNAGLGDVRQSPAEEGVLKLLVRRPIKDAREVLEAGELDVNDGLAGDCWKFSGGSVDTQLTLMNSRVIALIAGEPSRWPLAGDQLYVDLDLSCDNLPPGTRLAIGLAEVEVTAEPHTGCRKFSARFGSDAVKFVNSPEGRRLQLRGINARVVRPGTVRVGDVVRKRHF